MNRLVPLRYLLHEVDERGGDELPLLSVSIHAGVRRRDELSDDPPRADTLAGYKRCQAGDVVVNRMRAFQGALGVSGIDGLVSPDYAVLRPVPDVDARFIAYLLRSRWGVGEMASRLRGIGGVTSGVVRTPRINVNDLLAIKMPGWGRHYQALVADLLDRECARIVDLEARCAALNDNLTEAALSRFAALTANWPSTQIGHHYEVKLGKMLDEARGLSGDFVPYLRNQNIDWDRFDLGDVKQMRLSRRELARYEVRVGDLLACEGGNVGQSAIWNGEITPIYYQKALHRIRPLSDASNRFLMWCLWLGNARGDYYADGTGSTIPHLPAEKLRHVRIPAAGRAEQECIVRETDAAHGAASRTKEAAKRLRSRLTEYRDALITEAVTGQLDVTKISEEQMDERAHAAAEGEAAAVKSLVATAE